jgi:hypothetical protein
VCEFEREKRAKRNKQTSSGNNKAHTKKAVEDSSSGMKKNEGGASGEI